MSEEEKNIKGVLEELLVQLKHINGTLDWSIQWQKSREKTPLEELQNDPSCPFCTAYKTNPNKCVESAGCERSSGGYGRSGRTDKFEFNENWNK